MNARLCPDTLLRSEEGHAASPTLETDEIVRWVWQGPYGPIVIEVIGERVFVDGDLVEPHRP